jgi:hypothetical protein
MSIWKQCILEYKAVSKSFRTDHLERELQMVQLSATMCSFITILWVSIVSFVAITVCVASQRKFIVVLISLSTQSGNFWIHFCMLTSCLCPSSSHKLWRCYIIYRHTSVCQYTHNISGTESILILRQEYNDNWAVENETCTVVLWVIYQRHKYFCCLDVF